MFFKRKHKYTAFLPRRGGRKLLFSVKAKDIDEAIQLVYDKLETDYSEDMEIKGYKHVIVFDNANSEEYKINNPMYDREIAREQVGGSSKMDPQKLVTAFQLDLMDSMLDSIKATIPHVMQTLLTSNIDIWKELTKKMVEGASKPDHTSQLKNIAEFIQSIVLLAKNKDEVKALIQELKKEGIGLQGLFGITSTQGGEKESVSTTSETS